MSVVEYDVRDVSVTVDGVEIVELAPGGNTGITPHDDMKSKYGESLHGDVVWSQSPSTHCTGTIEVLKTSASINFLLEKAMQHKAVSSRAGNLSKIAILSNDAEKTRFKEISAENCKISYPEYKVTAEGKEVVAFPFEGNFFNWQAA